MSVKSKSSVEYFLQQLERSRTVNHIENIDITWGLMNESVISIQMLLFLFLKVSCLPLVPDFTDPALVEKLGITNEQAKNVQGFNSELIYTHGLLQKYILNQYSTASVCKNLLDEQIDNLPQADMSQLLNFLQNYKDVKSEGMQTGGMNLWKIAGAVTSIAGLWSGSLDKSTSMRNNTQEVTTTTPSFPTVYQVAHEDPSIRVFSTGVISKKPEEITAQFKNISESITSGNLSGIIQSYDESQSGITQIFAELGRDRTIRLLNDFNSKFSRVSKGATDTCIDLMSQMYQAGIFDNWRYSNSELEIIEQIYDAQNKFRQQQDDNVNNEEEGGEESTCEWSKDSPVNDDIPSMSNEKPSQQLTKKQPQDFYDEETKLKFADDLRQVSQLYCINGFRVTIKLTDDNQIQIIGDKVPYHFMAESIDSLQYNLKIAMSKMTRDPRNIAYLLLDSLNQRLVILKTILTKIGEFNIATLSLFDRENRISASPESLNLVEGHLQTQLKEFNELFDKLQESFPKASEEIDTRTKLEMDMIKLKGKQEKAAHDLNMENIKQENITQTNQQTEMDAQQAIKEGVKERSTNRTVSEMNSIYKAFSAFTTAFKIIALNSTEGLFQGASEYTQTAAREFTNLVGSPFLGIIDGLTGLSGKALWKLLFSPIGWIILVCVIIIACISIGGTVGSVRMFVDGSKRFIAVVFGPLVFLYRIIKTPCGYIVKLVGTFYNGNQGQSQQGQLERTQSQQFQLQRTPSLPGQFQRTQSEQSEYDATIQSLMGLGNAKWGGRKRKTLKTNKNKKNKTRKFRRGKKHNTRHRRRRLTIRR